MRSLFLCRPISTASDSLVPQNNDTSMLKTLIERAGYKRLFDSAQEQIGDSTAQKNELATVPPEISHFDLDR